MARFLEMNGKEKTEEFVMETCLVGGIKIRDSISCCASLCQAPRGVDGRAIETCGYDLSVKLSYFIVIFNLKTTTSK